MRLVRNVILVISLLGINLVYGVEGTYYDKERGRNIEYLLIFPDKATGKPPLVVVSHGNSGSYPDFKWLTEALVENGFAVLALNHPFNTARNNTPKGVFRIWDRPKDVSRLLDNIQNNQTEASKFDSNRIGIAGFSAGAYTGLALVGATIDLHKQQEFCEQSRIDPVCVLLDKEMFQDNMNADANESFKDERIKAVYAMAPAMGTAARISSLQGITAPVFITAAQDDTFLDPNLHARQYAGNIPGAQLSMVASGGHFVFLRCSLFMHGIQLVDEFADKFDLCGHNTNVVRDNVWREVAKSAVVFFQKSL